jgi:hypothetical protein
MRLMMVNTNANPLPLQKDRILFCRQAFLKHVLLGAIATFICVCWSGCDLIPRKPEDVFVVYRKRMINEQLEEARQLLSKSSLDLVKQLERNFKLDQSPEDLALLNILDPTSPPLIKSSDDTTTILQVRTLTAGLRLVRITRKSKDSHWKVDLTQELTNLQKFLTIRDALEKYRGQAGAFAGAWKSFMDQLEKMKGVRPPPLPMPSIKDKPKKKKIKGRAHRNSR